MHLVQCFFALLLLLLLPSAFAAPPGDCEGRLSPLRGGGTGIELDLSSLDQMADVLGLKPKERANVKAYAGFAALALETRARNLPILTLHSRYLTIQGLVLKLHIEDRLKGWSVRAARAQRALASEADRARAAHYGHRSRATLQSLHERLERRADELDLQTLMQSLIAVSVVEELANHGFLPSSSPGDTSLERTFGVTFDEIEAGMRAWNQGHSRNIGGKAFALVERAEALFKKFGLIPLPVVGTLSEKEGLALGFLPIQPLRLAGPDVTHFDLADMAGERGFSTEALRTRDPSGWVDALNAAFNTWFLLLGGHRLDRPPQGAAQDGSERELLIQALLHSLRYYPHGDNPDWTDPNAILKYLFYEYARAANGGFNPAVREFWFSQAPVLYREIGVRAPVYLADLARAVDRMLARLLRSPDLDFTLNENLRPMLQRFPTSAYTGKLLVMRAFGQVERVDENDEPH